MWLGQVWTTQNNVNGNRCVNGAGGCGWGIGTCVSAVGMDGDRCVWIGHMIMDEAGR